MMILIDTIHSWAGKLTISVTSESMPHLKRGAMRDFLAIMKDHGYYDDTKWNRTDFIYDFGNGKIFEFFSADQPDKVRGPRRDILFINEANNISFETFTQLEIRTSKVIWLDWNPVSEFWFYTDILPNSDDVDFLTLTYLDNEALSPEIIKSIESKKHMKNFWQVYGLGQLGEAEGRIYTGWTIIDEVPEYAKLSKYGLDFGYSNDPTAVPAIWEADGGFVLDEIVYQKGMSNKQIADVFLHQLPALVVADSSEPKSIDEISSYGVNIIPALKGADSVLQGIQYVQQQKIWVTKRSVNLIKEYRNYLWQTDKNGKILNVPESGWDHMMDAIRYALTVKKSKVFMPQSVGGVKHYFDGFPG